MLNQKPYSAMAFQPHPIALQGMIRTGISATPVRKNEN
jgi:hypothetical protein